MNIREPWSSFDRATKIQFGAGVLAILLLATAMLWWGFRKDDQLLFGNLKPRDAAEITQSLTEWKIPYTIADGGTSIKVPADKVYDTRMKLVAAGVPKGGHAGFELFDKSDFGVTEFAQRVNYQRALQGEIERTISSMPGVEDVRVHLTIRRPGLFSGDQEASKASVALSMAPGVNVSQQQIDGIRSLIAASVEGLAPSRVSVLDSNGGLLAAASVANTESGAFAVSDEEGRVESSIQAKVEHVLTQFLRRDQFRVSVDATLNADRFKEVSERPTSQGNTGNDLMSRQQTTSGYSSSGGKRQEDTQVEFVHGTTRTEIVRAPGQIEQLSIAVVIPPNIPGVTSTALESLVAAAAGINPQRGDKLQISSMGWVPPAAVPQVISSEDTMVSTKRSIPKEWWLWGAVALGTLIVLGLLSLWMRKPRTHSLSPAEREATLDRLRSWLAEGDSA